MRSGGFRRSFSTNLPTCTGSRLTLRPSRATQHNLIRVDGDELVFAVKNLAERLRQNVKTPKEAPQPTGSWSIDRIGQRLVPPQGKAMKLSGREAALISKLAEESGRIISRAELGLAMGYETILDTRSLDAVLQRLRVKARDAGTELPIQVIHGSGFQLSAKIIFR
ncbi:two-component response regulator [Agrobacterium rosae]|uniref:Two-component response regulator n=1 Tax=Agrobacterium rosae TaxID=1972867 RepID=A0A1R3TGP9_9HYPH|nr:two-component response regulator [Agrobacterium rosae]